MMQRGAGFTLVELMITVAMISILTAKALPAKDLIVKRSQEQELRTALREIRSALDAHKRAVEEGRVKTGMGESGYPKSLDELAAGVENVGSTDRQKIYFLRKIPRDPLHPDPSLPASQTWSKRSYTSAPDEPLEGADVFDVYSSASGRGINGVPYREW